MTYGDHAPGNRPLIEVPAFGARKIMENRLLCADISDMPLSPPGAGRRPSRRRDCRTTTAMRKPHAFPRRASA
ncbi:hypothetical protein OHA21_22025 [Actinoplanes sp. NBC_00393]|uniref:hypothetical protein n=1 Tax=Actinoplanes sp. NBC_00393 TaxID=2975953 RepID=UPI002E1BEED2